MNYGTYAIPKLAAGETCTINPKGNSMTPKVKSGATVTLRPYGPDEEPQEGDIVLCKVKGRVYLHLISAVRGAADARQFQISNNHGHVNGWVSRSGIYGVAIDIKNS